MLALIFAVLVGLVGLWHCLAWDDRRRASNRLLRRHLWTLHYRIEILAESLKGME